MRVRTGRIVGMVVNRDEKLLVLEEVVVQLVVLESTQIVEVEVLVNAATGPVPSTVVSR